MSLKLWMHKLFFFFLADTFTISEIRFKAFVKKKDAKSKSWTWILNTLDDIDYDLS